MKYYGKPPHRPVYRPAPYLIYRGLEFRRAYRARISTADNFFKRNSLEDKLADAALEEDADGVLVNH